MWVRSLHVCMEGRFSSPWKHVRPLHSIAARNKAFCINAMCGMPYVEFHSIGFGKNSSGSRDSKLALTCCIK